MRTLTHCLAAGLCAVVLTAGLPALAEKPTKAAPKPAAKAAPKPAAKAAPKPAAKAAAKYDEKKLQALEAKLAKKPNDAKLKQEVAEANYQVGHAYEYNPQLPPRVKYRTALKRYRRTLALNPKHAKARMEKDQIEAIYRQMGMPVP